MSFGTTLMLDENDDLVLDTNLRFKMVEGSDKVKQDVRITMRTHKGQDLFNPDYGLDKMTIIDRPTQVVVDRAIRSALNSYQYLDVVDDVRISFDTTARKVTIEIEVTVDEEATAVTAIVEF